MRQPPPPSARRGGGGWGVLGALATGVEEARYGIDRHAAGVRGRVRPQPAQLRELTFHQVEMRHCGLCGLGVEEGQPLGKGGDAEERHGPKVAWCASSEPWGVAQLSGRRRSRLISNQVKSGARVRVGAGAISRWAMGGGVSAHRFAKRSPRATARSRS